MRIFQLVDVLNGLVLVCTGQLTDMESKKRYLAKQIIVLDVLPEATKSTLTSNATSHSTKPRILSSLSHILESGELDPGAHSCCPSTQAYLSNTNHG